MLRVDVGYGRQVIGREDKRVMRESRAGRGGVSVTAAMDVESRSSPAGCWMLVESGSHTRQLGQLLGVDGRRLAQYQGVPPCLPVKRERLGALLHKQSSNLSDTSSSRDRRLAPHRGNESTSTSTFNIDIDINQHPLFSTIITVNTPPPPLPLLSATITQHTRPHPAELTNDLALHDSPHLNFYRHGIRKDCIRLHPAALHVGMSSVLPD